MAECVVLQGERICSGLVSPGTCCHEKGDDQTETYFLKDDRWHWD